MPGIGLFSKFRQRLSTQKLDKERRANSVSNAENSAGLGDTNHAAQEAKSSEASSPLDTQKSNIGNGPTASRRSDPMEQRAKIDRLRGFEKGIGELEATSCQLGSTKIEQQSTTEHATGSSRVGRPKAHESTKAQKYLINERSKANSPSLDQRNVMEHAASIPLSLQTIPEHASSSSDSEPELPKESVVVHPDSKKILNSSNLDRTTIIPTNGLSFLSF